MSWRVTLRPGGAWMGGGPEPGAQGLGKPWTSARHPAGPEPGLPLRHCRHALNQQNPAEPPSSGLADRPPTPARWEGLEGEGPCAARRCDVPRDPAQQKPGPQLLLLAFLFNSPPISGGIKRIKEASK